MTPNRLLTVLYSKQFSQVMVQISEIHYHRSLCREEKLMITSSRILGMSIAVSCFLIAGPALAKTSDELKALSELLVQIFRNINDDAFALGSHQS